jgi:hypothetical protein
LGLSLVEKVVYSVIYGFSQDGDSTFHGSRAYLASVCESSLKTIDRTLRSLVDRGLVSKFEKYDNGIKFCEYSANVPTGDILSGVGSNCPGGRVKMSHNNEDTIVSSNNDNIESRARAREEDDDLFSMPPFDEVEDPTPSPKPSPSPKTATRFTPPTLEEVAAYCRERGNKIDPQHFVNYYTSNGWMVGKNKMKDWRAAVRNWETRDKERNNGKRNIDPGSPAAYRQVGRGDYYGESTI